MQVNLDNLAPGETAVYFTGLSIAKSGSQAKYTAFEMYMRGEVELTQRRVAAKNDAGYTFEYLCTKRHEKPSDRALTLRHAHYSRVAGGA
jgi:hypothetical protein